MPVVIIFVVLIVLAALVGGLCGLFLLASWSKLSRKVNTLESRLNFLEQNNTSQKPEASIIPSLSPSREKVSASKKVSSPETAPVSADTAPAINMDTSEALSSAQPQESSTAAVTIHDHLKAKTSPSHKSKSKSESVKKAQSTTFDLEAFIAGKLFSWIAFLAIVTGAAFFLKLAYDYGWIGPQARIAIVYAVGIAGLVYGEHFRKSCLKENRSSIIADVISAASSGVLYLAVYFSYTIYGYLHQSLAFTAMAWFSAFTIFHGLRRNSQTLSSLGLIGAYLTPGLLSTGLDKGEVLLAFLTLIALASWKVCKSKNWFSPAPITVFFTVLNVFGWYAQFGQDDRLFVCLYGSFLLLLIAIIHPFELPSPDGPGRIASLTFLFGSLASLVLAWRSMYADLSIPLGITLCAMSMTMQLRIRQLGKRFSTSKILTNPDKAYALLAAMKVLSAALLILVAPAVVKGPVLLAVLGLAGAATVASGTSARDRSMTAFGVIVLVLSLLWGLSEGPEHTGLFIFGWNRTFLIWLAYWGSWTLSAALIHKSTTGEIKGFMNRLIMKLPAVVSYIMLFLLLIYEIDSWRAGALRFIPPFKLDYINYRNSLFLLFVTGLYPLIAVRVKSWITPVFYLILSPHFLERVNDLHDSAPAFPILNTLFIAAALTPIGLLISSKILNQSHRKLSAAAFTGGHFLGCILISAEIHDFISLGKWLSTDSRAWMSGLAITITFGIYGVSLLYNGISRESMRMRRLGMFLLSIAFIKVFLVDSAGLEQIWRVLSFIVVGIILMISSKIYIRWKGI